jgi:hypothetical protein
MVKDTQQVSYKNNRQLRVFKKVVIAEQILTRQIITTKRALNQWPNNNKLSMLSRSNFSSCKNSSKLLLCNMLRINYKVLLQILLAKILNLR